MNEHENIKKAEEEDDEEEQDEDEDEDKLSLIKRSQHGDQHV